MNPKRYSLDVVTDASGDASATLPGSDAIDGRVGFVGTLVYTKPGSGGYSDGVAISVVTEKTGITLWSETLSTNASKTVSPTLPTHDADGAETGGTDYIPLASEGVTITISGGGDTKSGTFTLVVLSPGSR